MEQDNLRIYSSLFYRCLETLRPTIDALQHSVRRAADSNDTSAEEYFQSLHVRGERGIGEWFGRAWFEQPVPAEPAQLKRLFYPWLDTNYRSRVIPPLHGECIHDLHDRVAETLLCVIRDVDAEFAAMKRHKEKVTLLICGHAAQIICAGRALTGKIPQDLDYEDFHCYTCGISKFVRKTVVQVSGEHDSASEKSLGLAGGWDCILNSDCSHLSQGEERGWHFHGDESFDSYGSTTSHNTIECIGGYKSATPKQLQVDNRTSSKL